MKLFSGTLKRAMPTSGLKIREETKKTPMRTPISASLAPRPGKIERKGGDEEMEYGQEDEL
jgi:hypothetical protein